MTPAALLPVEALEGTAGAGDWARLGDDLLRECAAGPCDLQ